jgi:hypothetical protein
MRCTNLGPVAGRPPGGPTDPKPVPFPTKVDFLKFFFVNFEKQISQCEMKCAKSLMFDGDAGVAGVTLLFLLFLKNKK